METNGSARRLQPGFISKSAYISGLQCHKLLWHSVHAPAQIPLIGDHKICVEAALGLQLSSDEPSKHFGGAPNVERMVRSHGNLSLHVCPSDTAEKIRSGSLNEQ